MKQIYPTFIVNTKDGSEYPFLVCVPDMEIFTEKATLADAIEMARDAIGLTGISMEDHKGVVVLLKSKRCKALDNSIKTLHPLF